MSVLTHIQYLRQSETFLQFHLLRAHKVLLQSAYKSVLQGVRAYHNFDTNTLVHQPHSVALQAAKRTSDASEIK